eukprot:scaffold81336_cov33-Phaeocystis_antarctica.AAC.1
MRPCTSAPAPLPATQANTPACRRPRAAHMPPTGLTSRCTACTKHADALLVSDRPEPIRRGPARPRPGRLCASIFALATTPRALSSPCCAQLFSQSVTTTLLAGSTWHNCPRIYCIQSCTGNK